jgi:FolB domain-containing protein
MHEAMGKILIRDLDLKCIIGINDPERLVKQDVRINVTLYADLKKACRTDSIDDAVNYRTITKDIISMVESSSFFLLEKLADEIARLCLKYPGVERADVAVDKPGALRFSRSVAVEVSRTKHSK